ncbi:MAG: peptidase, partial [Nitrososphaerota archaeon]
ENVEDNNLSGADYVIVIKPQSEQKPTFPIRLSSLVKDENGNVASGKFNVDLTWFPSTLGLGDAEFIITIYDKESGFPVPQAAYDFVLLKGDAEIYRKSGTAQAGGSFEDVKLSEQHLGNLVLKIENIAKSSEYAEIPIFVTPEFPISTILILFAGFGMILVMSKSRIKLNA